MQEPAAKCSFEQEVTRLPVTDFSALDLCLWTGGHVFGALVLQLLRIRTSIRRLKVEVVNWVTIRLLSHVSSASACIFFTYLVPRLFEVVVTRNVLPYFLVGVSGMLIGELSLRSSWQLEK